MALNEASTSVFARIAGVGRTSPRGSVEAAAGIRSALSTVVAPVGFAKPISESNKDDSKSRPTAIGIRAFNISPFQTDCARIAIKQLKDLKRKVGPVKEKNSPS